MPGSTERTAICPILPLTRTSNMIGLVSMGACPIALQSRKRLWIASGHVTLDLKYNLLSRKKIFPFCGRPRDGTQWITAAKV